MASSDIWGAHCSIWRLDAELWRFWYGLIKDLLPRLCVLLIAALFAIRHSWLRRVLQQPAFNWPSRLFMMAFFGLFSVIGTHSGDIIDQATWQIVPHDLLEIRQLEKRQIIVGLRDTWALVAGQVGGVWVGLGTGLLAGWDRHLFGGGWGDASAWATVLLGTLAGSMRRWSSNNVGRVLMVAVIGTLLQRVILLFSQEDICRAWELAIRIGIPVAIVNIAGCVLFVWVMQDLDRDRLENDAREARLLVLQTQVERDRQGQLVQQAELRALRAQVDPHFLNNTLNDLKALIRKDSESARLYVSELADFFRKTLKFSGQRTVKLVEELEQVQRYLTLQRLGYEDRLQVHITILPHLMDFDVLPFCLITLVENSLKYAFQGCKPPFHLHIGAEETTETIILYVRDSGCGISPDKINGLGKIPISSDTGSGVALYQLAQSLVLEFGKDACLVFESEPTSGTIARLYFPKRSH